MVYRVFIKTVGNNIGYTLTFGTKERCLDADSEIEHNIMNDVPVTILDSEIVGADEPVKIQYKFQTRHIIMWYMFESDLDGETRFIDSDTENT